MGLLSRLFAIRDRQASHDPDLDEALERAAYRVEPRLKQTRAWPRGYLRPIAAALAQARRVAADIPGPVDVDMQRFLRDPFVHSLFGTPEDIRRALCSSRVMHEYVASGVSHEAYILLSMRREEKNALGVDATGQTIRREVPQHLVWFSDHQLIGPVPSLEEARANLVWILFDRFLERVAVGVEQLRAERDRLAGDKDIAMARLHGAKPEHRGDIQKGLDRILKQLGDATQCLDQNNLAEIFATVLSHPEDCLYLRKQTLMLDNMGVLRHQGDGVDASEMTFVELIERYCEPRTVLLIHCPDIRPMSNMERMEEASRLLG
jgi:hypothetical protein